MVNIVKYEEKRKIFLFLSLNSSKCFLNVTEIFNKFYVNARLYCFIFEEFRYEK